MSKPLMVLIPITFILLLFACSEETATNLNSETIGEDFIMNTTVQTRSGADGCFEIIFPLAITLPDGSESDFTSFEELKITIQEWYENNPEVIEKPSLVFPIDLIDEDGNIISVESHEELKIAVKSCDMHFPPDHHNHSTVNCFELLYPISIVFQNGSILEVNSQDALKLAIQTWRSDNPQSTEGPHIQFPIQVQVVEDGSILTINSQQELRVLKRTCRL